MNLFLPTKLGTIEISNRMIMAPLTRNRCAPNGVPNVLNVEYYRQRATAGLIVTEGTTISPTAISYPFCPSIYNEEQIAGWKVITDAVHAEGGKIVIQLWHGGRISHPSLMPDNILPIAPSAIKPYGYDKTWTYNGLADYVLPRSLETEEIPDLINEYVHAVRCSVAAGFDGVEIHSANGYLLDQFLRSSSNQRTDIYGGSVENRCRLLLELINGISSAIDLSKVGIRLSPTSTFNGMFDSDPQQLYNYLVEQLNQFNLAYLHIIEGSHSVEKIPDIDHIQEFNFLEMRNLSKNSYVANLSYNKDRAIQAIDSGYASAVSFGKPFIANPDLVARYRNNWPLNELDETTLYVSGGRLEKGYTDYPFYKEVVRSF